MCQAWLEHERHSTKQNTWDPTFTDLMSTGDTDTRFHLSFGKRSVVVGGGGGGGRQGALDGSSQVIYQNAHNVEHRVDPNVNYGLQLTTHQYWFISC